MNRTRHPIPTIILALLLSSTLASCQGKGNPNHEGDPQTVPSTVVAGGEVIHPTTGNASATAEPETAPSIPIADTPISGSYEPTAETVITLGETVTIQGAGAYAEGTTVTITAAGTYLVSGTLNGGQLMVDTTDGEKEIGRAHV